MIKRMTGKGFTYRSDMRTDVWDDDLDALEASSVPKSLRGGLRRYVVDGIEPGSFLCAVIDNDLRGAMKRGDPDNVAALEAILDWLYNHAPSPCHGSKEARLAWQEKQGGAAAEEAAAMLSGADRLEMPSELRVGDLIEGAGGPYVVQPFGGARTGELLGTTFKQMLPPKERKP